MGLKDHVGGLIVGVAAPDGSASPSILTRTDGVTDLVLNNFNQITLENEMKPDKMAPNSEGNYTFGTADAFVSWATANGLTVHGHALLFEAINSPQVPQWMLNYQGNQAQWEAMTDTFIQDVVGHFAGTSLVSWDVVNEAFSNNAPYGRVPTIWQQNIGDDYIADAFFSARAADPNAELYYNDYGLIHNGGKLDAVIAMVDDYITRSPVVPIDGVGFQFHEVHSFPPKSTMVAAFQKVVDRGLKVKVTEIDIRLKWGQYAGATTLTPQMQAAQAVKFREAVEAYLDTVPESLRGGFSVWGVKDDESWFAPDWPLLWDANLNPKDAYTEVDAALAARATIATPFLITSPVDGALGVGSPVLVSGSGDDTALGYEIQVDGGPWVPASYNAGLRTFTADDVSAFTEDGAPKTVRARRFA